MSKDLYIEGGNVTHVVKALSNDVRLKILSLLSQSEMNIQTLAGRLNLSKTAVLAHINLLEEAGFVQSQYLPGTVGKHRVCRRMYDRLIFNFAPKQTTVGNQTYYESEIAVGNYFDFEAWAPCGLASVNSIIKKWDDPTVFYDLKRTSASLIWTAFGFIEYKVPIDPLFAEKKITAIEEALEVSAHQMVQKHRALCMPPYMSLEKITDGTSDFTLWINGTEIGTTTFGVGKDPEKAIYTPTWWRSLPFHGFPLSLRIDATGCYINDKRTSDHSFEQLIRTNVFRFRIGVKENAEYSSGLMIFGHEFGSSCNNITIRSYIE